MKTFKMSNLKYGKLVQDTPKSFSEKNTSVARLTINSHQVTAQIIYTQTKIKKHVTNAFVN